MKKIILLFIFFFLSLAAPGGVDARAYDNAFLMSGDLNFAYEKTFGSVKRDRFVHEYNLKLKGFVVDPRLVLFELRGSAGQELRNPGDTLTTYAIGTTVSLLNAKVVRGPLRYFPNPFIVRLDYLKSTIGEMYSYGFTFDYLIPGKLAFFRNGKIISMDSGQRRPVAGNRPSGTSNNSDNSNSDNENSDNNAGIAGSEAEESRSRGLVIPLPALHVDYDSYQYTEKGSAETRTYDTFNFRAESSQGKIKYLFDYLYTNNSRTGGNTDSENKNHRIDLNVNYHSRNDQTDQTIDVFNRLLYFKHNDISNMNLMSRGYWLTRLGAKRRDSLLLSAIGRYATSDEDRDYSVEIAGTYNKMFSERANNYLNGSIMYGSTNGSDFNASPGGGALNNYGIKLSDTLTYELSRTLVLKSNLAVDVRDTGQNYGFGINVATRARVALLMGYSYLHSGMVGDEFDNHRVEFIATTRLRNNLYLTSTNFYQIGSRPNGEDEKLLSLRGDLYWNYLRYRVSLGVQYQNMKGSGTWLSDNSMTLIHASVTRTFRNRLSFTSRVAYSIFNSDHSILEFDNTLTWRFRKIFLSAEYLLRKSDLHGTSQVEHRVFFNVRRYFSQRLLPFL